MFALFISYFKNININLKKIKNIDILLLRYLTNKYFIISRNILFVERNFFWHFVIILFAMYIPRIKLNDIFSYIAIYV